VASFTSTAFLPNMFRCYKIFASEQLFSLSVHYCWPIFAKTGIGPEIFVKLPSIKFHEKPFGASRVVTRVQTDEATAVSAPLGSDSA
jgi:hypothetical protein